MRPSGDKNGRVEHLEKTASEGTRIHASCHPHDGRMRARSLRGRS